MILKNINKNEGENPVLLEWIPTLFKLHISETYYKDKNQWNKLLSFIDFNVKDHKMSIEDTIYDENGAKIIIINLLCKNLLSDCRYFHPRTTFNATLLPLYKHNLYRGFRNMKHITPEKEYYYYFINFGDILFSYLYKNRPDSYNLKDKIKFTINDILKTKLDEGNTKILLNTSNECVVPELVEWDYFYDMVQRPPTDFIHLTGDARLQTSDYIPTIYHNCWERAVCTYKMHYAEHIMKKIENIKKKKEVKWHGLCLNRITKPHRIIMCKFFDEHLKDKINYSFGIQTLTFHEIHPGFKGGDHEKLKTIDKILIGNEWFYGTDNFKEKRDDTQIWIKNHGEKNADNDYCDMGYNMNSEMHEDSYHNSYFNIVTESACHEWEESTTFLTEKIFKPILWYQPFIIVGQPYSIDFLRKCHYDVFDDIIDHSYDEVSPFVERIDLIKKEIKRLCEISKKEWADILYNILPRLSINHKTLEKAFLKFNELDRPLYKGEYLT